MIDYQFQLVEHFAHKVGDLGGAHRRLLHDTLWTGRAGYRTSDETLTPIILRNPDSGSKMLSAKLCRVFNLRRATFDKDLTTSHDFDSTSITLSPIFLVLCPAGCSTNL